ncbi:hypothetical protein F0919_10265 [Taibaiella lutea]|uniref:DUF3137 domain-containing protein n=1 Tax=Taibaiella lutea TaxID=2608001 RepID=A0A5M6CIY1_9BACT|nr:hypothetical protein [Taibaiella lutea]KAA5534973.1 hypothetical protein F0919_10265 [Taibaiella lutea]
MKESIWKTLAEELNGSYIQRQYDHSDKAIISFDKFHIIFDNYTFYRTVNLATLEATYTRIVCPFTSNGNFKFQIYRKNFLDIIGKLFGLQDIVTGHEEFDKEFIIKSNDDYKVSEFLNDSELLELIRKHGRFHIEISDQKEIWGEKLPESNYELSFYLKGKLNSIETLIQLYLIFTKLITQLSKVEIINPVNE